MFQLLLIQTSIAVNLIHKAVSFLSKQIRAKEDSAIKDCVQPIKENMARLVGSYAAYKGIERVNVVKKGGLLYLETKTPFSETIQPLIPVNPLEGLCYYTSIDGLRAPIEFEVKKDGKIDLYVERYCYHKEL